MKPWTKKELKILEDGTQGTREQIDRASALIEKFNEERKRHAKRHTKRVKP